MSDRERSDSGQFVETVTLGNVLAVFDQVRGPVITSSDVSDELECTTEAARQKLTRLYDQGRVDKRKTGRTVVYWYTDQQSGHSTPVEQSPTERDVSPEPIEEPREDEPAATETDAALDDALEGWKPGNGAKDTERRREIGRQALEWLREQPTPVQKADFESALYEQTSLENQGVKSWWVRVVRPGLDNAAERGYVDNSGRSYEWIGE